ncbi:ribosome modulation factor (plasmid) [Shewanella xiamenensis]|uniref:Ribosome modulation factor n=2 Tax=Shewanella TaxID=22 RepID=A0AAE4TQE3_9GAMM|nr:MULTISPECIES: ribosome modulation factor [Shewanella]MCK7657716.1 ribosome modulation factor [Shewanella sp. JNE4-2]MCT8858066.1 ribosome modulation factor [Shewanella xiamenensis]MDH0451066.1 ribosome modulation factor [Shewanella sp. GD04112]MDV5393100.1 ribosome modulation factor [Shewanella xiamenensis]UWG66943.1 ribosome modulation factor [Shewanella xiamenensis]
MRTELLNAELKGRKAGLIGKSIHANPYTEFELKEMWLKGWEDGARLREPYISDVDPRYN